MFNEKERMEELQSIREESSKMDREEGARKRPAITMIALVMIVWLVVLFFDFAAGRSVTAPTAIALTAFAGMCWGNYRETHERSFGLYALVAGVIALVCLVAHFMGI